MTGDRLPPLVTSSPATTSLVNAGVLTEPGTQIVFGNQSANTQFRSGARVVMGWWMSQQTRLEGEWFGLATQHTTWDGSSNSAGLPILARPYFDLTNGLPNANVVAYPGQLIGSINANVSSSFTGAGMQFMTLCSYSQDCYHSYRVDFIYGFRYVGLYEKLSIHSTSTSIQTTETAQVGTTLTTNDRFGTSNNFVGGNIGAMLQKRAGPWSYTGVARLGVGATAEHVNISGSSTSTPVSGAASTFPGGLLAMPSNIGNYNRGGFALLPQLELKLGYDYSPRLRFTVGYDVLYWSRVVRPGAQVDTFVNTSQAGGQQNIGTPGPLFGFRETDLWVQGLSVGSELKF
jgi:hypothetical protein